MEIYISNILKRSLKTKIEEKKNKKKRWSEPTKFATRSWDRNNPMKSKLNKTTRLDSQTNPMFKGETEKKFRKKKKNLNQPELTCKTCDPGHDI